MRPAEILIAFTTWQADPKVSPLTCGTDSHRPLAATIIDERVVLFCPDCEYRQTHIPEIILLRAGLIPD